MIVFQAKVGFQECVSLWSTWLYEKSTSNGGQVGEQPAFLFFILEAVGQGHQRRIKRKYERTQDCVSTLKINLFPKKNDQLG